MILRVFRRVQIALIIGLALVATTSLVYADDAKMESQLEEFLNILDGDWDNNWFVLNEAARGVPPDQQQRHHHSIFRRMELPNLGPNIVYAQKWRDHDPDNVYVVSAYVITPDVALSAIHMEIFKPDRDRFRNAHIKPEVYSRLRQLKPDDYKRMPYGCSSYFKKNEQGVFEGSFIEPCHLGVTSDQRITHSDTEMKISPNQLSVLLNSTDTSFYHTSGHLQQVPRSELKARWYKCNLTVSNRDIPEPLERFVGVANGSDDVMRFQSINLHDQGGEVRLTVPTAVPENYRLRLTNLRNPGHRVTDATMKLELLVDDSQSSLATGIANPSSTEIGFESGDFAALCKQKPGNWYATHSRPKRVVGELRQ